MKEKATEGKGEEEEEEEEERERECRKPEIDLLLLPFFQLSASLCLYVCTYIYTIF